MPYSRPRSTREFKAALEQHAKWLRKAAGTYRQQASRVVLREDLRASNLKVAAALCDAADLLENRLFREF